MINSNAESAHQLLSIVPDEGLEDLSSSYLRNAQETAVSQVEFKTKKPEVSVLYMSELLLGNQNSATDFYINTMNQISQLPETMKPDVIVLSGFMQGDFKFFNKKQRATLVPELNSMDRQFHEAREMIKLATKTGSRVIYNMSNDDRRIASEYTVEVFRKMLDLANQHAKAQNKEIDHEAGQATLGIWGVDKLKQHPQWQEHLQFQIDTIFPYCLRSGRRLRSATEMALFTEGKIEIDEYMMLYKTCKRIKHGKEPRNKYVKWLDMESLKDTDFNIVDDFNLHIKTKGTEYNDWIRHSLGFSTEPMYQNHMKPLLNILGQLATSGFKTPDMLVTEHNQEAVGVSSLNSWGISSGGLIRARNMLGQKGSKSDAGGDVSKRMISTRGRFPEPSATAHTRTDDGSHKVTFFLDSLNEKSDSLTDRMAIVELCDLQTGSITARPDILAKYLDWIRVKAIGESATSFLFGGDMIHGRNYSNFPMESQSTGLMSVDSQKLFNTRMFETAFSDVTYDEMNALDRVLVQPGNHEWNSGTFKWHGDSFTDYLNGVFRELYLGAGFTKEEARSRVRSHDALMTQRGEYISGGYTGIEYFGDYGVLIQHYLLDRGGKGSGGDIPVYQTHHYAVGAGEMMKNIDILMQGHWHHPQYAVLGGNKLGIVGGSIAGLSHYELTRGYRATIAGTITRIGGGLPVEVEFISEEAINSHKIQKGDFANKVLKEEGYRTDRGFDVSKHGIWLPDGFPKSALQKKVLQLGRDVTQRSATMAVLR
jgi:hypothetical protein